MKRFFVIIIFAVFLMFPLVAHADVVMGNDFLDKNSEKTEPLGRMFQVNGVNGNLSSTEKPGSSKVIETYENGSLILIGNTYLHKNKYWGIPPISHSYWMSGWLPMDELLMVYGRIDFETEYQNELYDYSGSVDVLLSANRFYLWQWPGSDREKQLYDYMDLDESAIKTGHAYMDDEGREWVFVSLWGGPTLGGLSMTGASDGWVCLSDLDNSQIPAFHPAPEPIQWVHGEEPDWYGTSPQTSSGGADNSSTSNGYGTIFIVIIAAACIATAIIITVIVKKKT